MDTTASPPDWSDQTILIAEDMDNNFTVLAALLKKTNATLLHAQNGKEAVRLTQQNPDVAVILMDITMPEMDGIEATRIIKQLFPQKIVIAQTAHNPSNMLNLDNFNHIIQKPYNKRILFDTLSKYLS